MDILKKQFASKLLQIKAIKLQPNNPFTWASGWKSPFYCDNRKTLSYADLRSYVKLELVHAVLEHFPQAEAVAGVATGAIAQGALVADELNLPFVYVRSKPKDHGMENLIEGDIKPGQKVVLIEDQLSTGNNCMKCLNTVREAGGIVLGVVVIFDYQFSLASKALKRAKLPIITLTNFDTMMDVAEDDKSIGQPVIDVLQQWHNDPENWTPMGFDTID